MDIIRDKTKQIVGADNPLVKEINKNEDSGNRSGVAYAIRRLCSAACSLYTDEDMNWDDVVDNLARAIGELKGKESDLLKAYQEDIKKEGKSESPIGY